MRYPNLNSILFAPWRRIVSFVLAMLLFTTSAPIPAFSVESGEQGSGGQSGSVSTPNSGELIYDYDTLHITRDGEDITTLDLLHHEKIELSADGVAEEAKYQWQVQHPEKDDVWVNVYDGTKQNISVTLALVENVLRENGTAKLRCRAYTDTYAYLSNSVTVTVLHEQAVTMPAMYAMPKVNGSAVVADAVDTPEFVTITINYIRYYYSDGELVLAPEEAFPSYVATLTYNAPRPNAVPCPELVGYQAGIERVTVGGVDDPTAAIFGNDQITLRDANITSDIVITVRYNPKQVQYQVRYFFQNVYDDLYVEDDSLKGPLLDGSGFTGTTPDLKQQNVPGFTCLFYEPDSIAADGSTVFYVYYERNYYLMEFDCDGGYGTDTVYVRYGTHVVVPDPVRSGYVFAGWDLVSCKDDDGNTVELPGTTAVGTADSLPATLPQYNTIYTALWSKADTTCTVVYWLENADDSDYSYFGSVQIQATTGTIINLQNISQHSYCTDEINQTYAPVPLVLSDLKNLDTSRHAQLNEVKTKNAYDLDENGVLVNYGTSTNPLYGVQMRGDGSTTVNIYYTRNTYSLKFYYAMSGKRGTDEDIDYLVVGGTSYNFGGSGSSTATELELLRQYASGGSVGLTGEVKTLPAISDDVVSNYTKGTEVDSNNYTYYYFFFTAKYGQNLSTIWPRNPFIPVEVDFKSGFGDYAIFSAWNGEKKVKYCNNSNQTIKGNYMQLTEDILWDASKYGSGYADTTQYDVNGDGIVDNNAGTVAYLAFWENGAPNIGWNKPELYVYRVWKICERDKQYYIDRGYSVKEREIDGNNTGQYYYLFDSYFTCDNSTIGEQTPPPVTGYDKQDGLNWTPIFVTNTTTTDNVSYSNGEVSYNGTYFYHTNTWSVQANLSVHSLGESKYLIYDQTVYNPTVDDPMIVGAPNATFDHTHYREAYYIDYFYTPTNHKLKYYNYDKYLNHYLQAAGYEAGDGSTIAYGTNLAIYGPSGNMVTDAIMQNVCYPSSLEPGAYYFDGWYTSPTYEQETEMDWNSTMPDSDLTIYAKWSPVVWDVHFYLTSDGMNDYLALTDAQKEAAGHSYFWWPADKDDPYPITIMHGKALGTAFNYIPERYIDKNGNGQIDADETEKYSFVGWFYIDENGKKRFAPDTMEVKRDLHLFAEWRTEMDTEYTINYVMQDSKVPIAEPTNGHMSVGHTKTFEAKSGSQLYDAYQDKTLFPTTSSHSILMEPKAEDNTFTFEYVEEDSVWYQVKYVNKVTGVELGNKPKEKSTNAIVTEKYKAFAGFIPESYYITRVLTADGDATAPIAENIIVFYYIPTETTALYTVQLYQEKLDSTDASKVENYELVQSAVFSGIIGNTMEYEVDSDRFAGFTYKFNTVTDYVSGSASTVTNNNTALGAYLKPSGKLTDMGLEFKIYYSRNTVEYTIQFLEWGTGEPLGYGKLGYNGEAYSEKDTSVYKVGSTHSFTAPNSIAKNDITYYFFETDEKKQTQSLTMQANKDTNVLTFYFKAKEVTIYYHAICLTPGAKDQDFGRVSQSHEFITSSTVNGSTAMPSSGFKFVGWFTTQECKDADRVPDNYVDGNGRLTPSRPNADVHYYALFAPVLSSMTITKKVNGETDDSFLFRVQGVGKTDYIDIIVSISGNGSVTLADLPVGDYIVTELTNWSWEYEASPTWSYTGGGTGSTAAASITVSTDGGTITFTNTYVEPDWLGGEGSKENVFTNP